MFSLVLLGGAGIASAAPAPQCNANPVNGPVTCATWVPLTNQPTFLNRPNDCAAFHNANCSSGVSSKGFPANFSLLTDGRVLIEGFAQDNSGNGSVIMFTLTPDITGSYQNGTLTPVAPLPAGYTPNDFGSAVLPDGRVIYVEGEYNDPLHQNFALTDQCAIYDPVADTWTSVPAPTFFTNLWPAVPPNVGGFLPPFFPYPRYPSPFTSTIAHPIGDAQTVVLANGTLMMADKLSKQAALFHPEYLSTNDPNLIWTETGTATKYDLNSEESWVLLPNGKVLTMDMYLDYEAGLPPIGSLKPPFPPSPPRINTLTAENTELYDPVTGQWSSAGSISPSLVSFPVDEIGPSVLRPDGTVLTEGVQVIFGPNGWIASTWLYNATTNQWTPAPPLPTFQSPFTFLYFGDVGAALLPNGNVLESASPLTFIPFPNAPAPSFSSTRFYEFDGSQYIEQPKTPNAQLGRTGGLVYLILPTGEILASDLTTDLELYRPANRGHDPAWEPVIKSVKSHVKPGRSYVIRGVLFNGMSQGAMYGDEFQTATNYPLVRITNLNTGHVFYNRTHDHSFMGVAAKTKPVHTTFDVPLSQETGPSKIEVVANGIPSQPICIIVQGKGDDDANNGLGQFNKQFKGQCTLLKDYDDGHDD